MVVYCFYRGRALRIAVGIMVLMLVIVGGAEAGQLFNISGTKYNGSGISLLSGTKKTMETGETWDMGQGWTLYAVAIDARANPRQVRFTLSKNGIPIDDINATMGQTINYNNIFFTKVDSIFSGPTSDMVQLTDAFLMEKAAEPLSGWKINIRNTTTGMEIANTTTGVSGFYKFTGLSPGVYNVYEEMRGGWVNAAPLSQIVTISRSNVSNLNFTNLKLIAAFNISGFKINDSNGNGVWDAGEVGIPGGNITLKNATDAFVSSTMTDAKGFYQFTKFTQGNYNLTEVMQAGWDNTNETFNQNISKNAATIVTVISPNGGEPWARGTTQTIRWTYSGTPGSNVRIELLKGGVLNRTLNSSVPIGGSGSGSYNWLINSTQTPASDYKVRITSTTNATYNDTSDNNFTILAIPSGYSYIYGKVINDSVGIAVALIITNTSVPTTTDTSGFYSLLVPAGKYNLTTTKEPAFYKNSSVVVTAISGTSVLKDIMLTRKLTGTISGTVRTAQPANAVEIKDFAFSPNTVTVTKGTTVTWTNDDGVPHTVTSISGAFDSGNIEPGKTYSYTFNQAGPFEYSCANHPSMTHGKVIVT